MKCPFCMAQASRAKSLTEAVLNQWTTRGLSSGSARNHSHVPVVRLNKHELDWVGVFFWEGLNLTCHVFSCRWVLFQACSIWEWTKITTVSMHLPGAKSIGFWIFQFFWAHEACRGLRRGGDVGALAGHPTESRNPPIQRRRLKRVESSCFMDFLGLVLQPSGTDPFFLGFADFRL